MRALSSANVFSLSSNPGGSTPASRAAAFLAWSQALCTWRVNANISGKRRALSSAAGSIRFASAYASALARSAASALRPISELTHRTLTWGDPPYVLVCTEFPGLLALDGMQRHGADQDRKSTRLNSSHVAISY